MKKTLHLSLSFEEVAKACAAYLHHTGRLPMRPYNVPKIHIVMHGAGGEAPAVCVDFEYEDWMGNVITAPGRGFLFDD